MTRVVSEVSVILAVAIFLLWGTVLWAGDTGGESTFQALKCTGCHKEDRKAAGPSLPEISKAYAGRGDQLVRYLMGESEPLVDTGKAKMMAAPLKKTRELSDGECKNLANYILGFSGR